MTQTRREAAQRAISKALEIRPPVMRIDAGFYAVGSSREGHGYLLEVSDCGDLWCPCEASQRGLPCFHRAALGLHLGTIPQAWLPALDVPIGVDIAAVAS